MDYLLNPTVSIMKFDVERLEREVREDAQRVAAIEARHRAIDDAFHTAVKTCFDALAEPWRALGAYISATNQSTESP